MVWFEKKVRVRKIVGHVCLNCEAILYIELAGGVDMEIHSPDIKRNFQLSSSAVFRKLRLSGSL